MIIDWKNIKIHPAADEYPMMSTKDIEALAEDIRANGLQVPLVIWEDNESTGDLENGEVYLLDGRNRLKAIQSLGFAGPNDVPRGGELKKALAGFHFLAAVTRPAQFGSGKATVTPWINPWLHATSLNLKRNHLTDEQKNVIVERAIRRFPLMSDRAIAKEAGVGHPMVGRVRKALQVSGLVQDSTPLSRVQVAAEAIRANPGLSERQVAEKAGVAQSTVRDAKKKLASPPVKATVAPKTDPREENFNAAVDAAVETIRNRARIGGIGPKEMPRFIAAVLAALEV